MGNRILPEQKIIGIQTPEDLDALADDLGVRADWHEPDEQNVSAYIRGNHLDNAMGSTMRDIGDDNSSGEFNIVIQKDGEDVAVINLATLLSWGASIVRRRSEAFDDGVTSTFDHA